MQAAIYKRTAVLPGGKIEIADLKLPIGESVDVFVLLSHSPIQKRRSALDILAEASGQRLFKKVEEVDAYIREERDSWEN